MDFKIVSILVSFLLGFFLIIHISKYDLYEKEPYKYRLISLFVGGFISVILCSILYELISISGVSDDFIRTFLGSFLIIGPVEEISKTIALIIVFLFVKKAINEPLDGIMYMSYLTLGFSLIENYFYSLGKEQEYLLILRLFISTPMHISFSAVIGLSLYKFSFKKQKILSLIYSIIWASFLHGLFDAVIFGNLSILLIPIVFIYWDQLFILIKNGNRLSPIKKHVDTLENITPNPQLREVSCNNCGNNEISENIFNNMNYYSCNKCNQYSCTLNVFAKLCDYFLPEFINIKGQIYPELLDGKVKHSIKRCFYLKQRNSNNGYFDINRFKELVENYNSDTNSDFKNRWHSPGKYIKNL